MENENGSTPREEGKQMDKAPEGLESLFNSELFTYATVIAATVWGALVSYFDKVKKKSWRKLLTHMSSSAFAGAMVWLLATAAGLPGPLMGALCGIAAHMGTPALVALLMRSKVVKKFLDEGESTKQ